MAVDEAALKTADIVVIVIHFIVVLTLGIWVSKTSYDEFCIAAVEVVV